MSGVGEFAGQPRTWMRQFWIEYASGMLADELHGFEEASVLWPLNVSYGTHMTNSGMIQIHSELEESAQMSGATTFATFREVVVPLLSPTLIYAWLWIALLVFRELTLAVILTTPRNMTLPVVIWTTWLGGGLGQASALVVVMLALMIPLVVLYWFVTGRYGLLSARGDA